MSHYIHESIPDAKFEADSSFNIGGMTSQNFPPKNESSNVAIKGFIFFFKKKSFYVQNRSSRPKIDPHVNFSNFQAEENFLIFKIFGTSR